MGPMGRDKGSATQSRRKSYDHAKALPIRLLLCGSNDTERRTEGAAPAAELPVDQAGDCMRAGCVVCDVWYWR